MILELGDASIYYEIYGEGIPILMLHGFASDHRLMYGACEPTMQQIPHVKRIYIDLPGMGNSPSQEWINSADDLLQILLRFLDEILSGMNFAICAHSYGSYLARGVLKEKREQILGAFMFCPVIQPIHKLRNRPSLHVLQEDPQLLSHLSPYELKKYTTITVIDTTITVIDILGIEFLPGIQDCDRGLFQRVMKNYRLRENPDDINRPYSFPTVMLMGRQDSVVGYKDAWAILDNFTFGSFLIIDRAGHNLHAEQPEIFQFHLNQWLQLLMKNFSI